jgi:excisionase family DNA binding protein
MISRPKKEFKPENSENGQHKLVSMRQAGEVLGVSEWTVRTLCCKGALPCVRVGRLLKVDMADLLAFIARNKQSNAPAAMSVTAHGL